MFDSWWLRIVWIVCLILMMYYTADLISDWNTNQNRIDAFGKVFWWAYLAIVHMELARRVREDELRKV